MAIEAVDRSRGELVEFGIMYFGTDEILQEIVGRSKSLRCLRLATCYQVSDEGLIEVVKWLPLLEELELCLCSFTKEVIEVVGRSCPQLKYFRLNQKGVMYPLSEFIEEFNDEAFTIAANMPQLSRLHLFGNLINNTGLQAILDRCPRLEYLDLRQCYNIDIKGDLLKKCEGIKDLRLPNDSTDGYEFDSSVYYAGTYNEDYASDEEYAYDYSDAGGYNYSEDNDDDPYEYFGF